MRWLLATLLAGAPSLSAQDPEPGISLALAQERAARVSDVRARMHFRLEPGIAEATGETELRFRLSDASAPLVVDFAGRIETLTLNGRVDAATGVRGAHNHLVLPAAALRVGENILTARVHAAVAETGTPLTVYRDKADGAEYFYTLVVPADAHRIFPCFDQTNLKTRVSIALTVPEAWEAVANGPAVGEPEPAGEGFVTWRFAESPPLSTYLVAFAAGPFARVHAAVDGDAVPPMSILYRKSKEEHLEAELLFRMHRQSIASLSARFGHPYPFQKLDFVLAPGFPYGGMEHAGAIFYRETALLFDHTPTEVELARRSTLLYHEVAHQWFGNLVTMEWFDDLWLKEGFATFMGYTLFDELEPAKNAWLRFHQQVKPRAYAIDGTPGTVPVYQPLGNMADAKSNYGPIVYNKAPAVLRELEQRLGPEVFFQGVGRWLETHSWGNATWLDLLAALEHSSESDLSAWSQGWILDRGLPVVRAEWEAEVDGRITSFLLHQESAIEEARRWPLQVRILLARGDSHDTITVRFDRPTTAVTELVGTAAPDWVLLNADDVAYGRFLLDPASREALLAAQPGLEDPLTKAVAFEALWESVREAELHPQQFADLALGLLASERDALTYSRVLGTLRTTIDRYLEREPARVSREKLASLLLFQLLDGQRAGMELQLLRAACGVARTERHTAILRDLLEGERTVEGLTLGAQDRFRIAAALVAAGAGDEDELQTLAAGAEGEDVGKWRFLARAARPDGARKAEVFTAYLRTGDPPEQWVQDSLGWFHWSGQTGLTLPYLLPALEQVEWVKANRKIFFMPAWIDAFVNAHSSPAALRTVEEFLAQNEHLSPDIQRKLLQSLDGLRRAVRVRARWRESTE